jgi:hypothetical protein
MQIESYLTALRFNLGPISLAEREENVREISAHIRDSSEVPGTSLASVLAGLGPAEKLASQYRDGLLIRHASHSNSPLVLLRGALRLATKGVFGTVVFFVGMSGYLIGGGLVLSAFIKPILPANTGVWFDGNGHFMSEGVLFPPPGSGAHEVLGVWFIPISLIMGSLTLLFTTWAIRTGLRISQRWQSKL